MPYKQIQITSLSYFSWLKLMLISALPIQVPCFVFWLLEDQKPFFWLVMIYSIMVGCFLSALIGKFGMWMVVSVKPLTLRIKNDEIMD